MVSFDDILMKIIVVDFVLNNFYSYKEYIYLINIVIMYYEYSDRFLYRWDGVKWVDLKDIKK